MTNIEEKHVTLAEMANEVEEILSRIPSEDDAYQLKVYASFMRVFGGRIDFLEGLLRRIEEELDQTRYSFTGYLDSVDKVHRHVREAAAIAREAHNGS